MNARMTMTRLRLMANAPFAAKLARMTALQKATLAALAA
jgi:hypothetical protein